MKTLIVILTVLTLTSCGRHKNKDRLYYLSNSGKDTNFIEKPRYDTTNLTVIAKKEFRDPNDPFSGQVIKLTNEPAGQDGGVVSYLTPDLGIIYSKSTTWPGFTRLHSENDSVEKRINDYLDHILSCTDLVVEGDLPIMLVKSCQFTPPGSTEQ